MAEKTRVEEETGMELVDLEETTDGVEEMKVLGEAVGAGTTTLHGERRLQCLEEAGQMVVLDRWGVLRLTEDGERVQRPGLEGWIEELWAHSDQPFICSVFGWTWLLSDEFD